MNGKAAEPHFHLRRTLLLGSHSSEALSLAAAEFRTELRLSPEDGACEFQLGQSAQVKGNPADPKAHFERATELSLNFVQALISLGKLADKNYGKAIQLLSRATAVQATNEAADLCFAQCLQTLRPDGQSKSRESGAGATAETARGRVFEFSQEAGEKQQP